MDAHLRKPHEPKVGEELPRLPYDSLYQRCACDLIGLSPEIWEEFGPEITAPNGTHSLQSCRPSENPELGDFFPRRKG